MTSKSGTTLDYGTTAPKHAVKYHGCTAYTYDANGSMTARGTETIKYDPEQRPIRVQDGNAISRATYDGDGVRRKRLDSNGTVHYLGGYERKLAGGSSSPETITKYYSALLGAMSRPVAFRRGGTLHWAGSDHLGGTIRVLDSSFAALDGMRYRPYGEDRDTGNALVTDRKFTGQTEDEAAGLYWYASRAYDPAIGRFVSPDSIVPAPANPQSLNRYSYVYNNPLGYVDPSGHVPKHWDPTWVANFKEAHDDRDPTDRDWADYQFSLQHPGTGPNGTWTEQNWVAYTNVRQELGDDLLERIGQPTPIPNWKPAYRTGYDEKYRTPGPDSTDIYIGNSPIIPPERDNVKVNAITIGNAIFMRPRNEPASKRADEIRFTVIHEYVHVLQYRHFGGLSYMFYYWQEGLSAWDTNKFERQAIRVEQIYRENPWLPAPWHFPVAGR